MAKGLNEQEAALATAVSETYATLAYETYGDAVAGVVRLLGAVDALLEKPNVDSLVAARNAWLAARRPYQQSEVLRFYDGPIDQVETLVNTWPIDENFVEAGQTGAKPGIIEDSHTYPEISTQLLSSVNMQDGETSVSTGYHVIEFLLWGRDTKSDGAGDRPFTDYVTQPPVDAKRSVGSKVPVLNAETPSNDASRGLAKRRGAYLRSATALLLEHLKRVHAAWEPGRADNYRAHFLQQPRGQSLGLILKGMGALSGAELSGERLTVAYETKDQENEHSCFSDTTHIDVWLNALGIQNVCLGRYERRDGSVVRGQGLCDLATLRDEHLGQRLRTEIERSVNATHQIPAPFDQSIRGADDAPGRQAIQQAITLLRQQTQTLAEVAALFDLRVAVVAGADR